MIVQRISEWLSAVRNLWAVKNRPSQTVVKRSCYSYQVNIWGLSLLTSEEARGEEAQSLCCWKALLIIEQLAKALGITPMFKSWHWHWMSLKSQDFIQAWAWIRDDWIKMGGVGFAGQSRQFSGLELYGCISWFPENYCSLIWVKILNQNLKLSQDSSAGSPVIFHRHIQDQSFY